MTTALSSVFGSTGTDVAAAGKDPNDHQAYVKPVKRRRTGILGGGDRPASEAGSTYRPSASGY